MTKVIGPLNSSEARGRVGALVYNTWRGIRYVKSHVTPVQPGSAKQLAHRARVAAANTAWKALTDSQRRRWDDYATRTPQIDWTGSPYHRSGYSMFISNSVRAVYCGGSNQTEPPTTEDPYAVSTMTLTDLDMSCRVAWTTPTQPTGHTYRVEVWRHGPISAGRQPRLEHAIIVAVKPLTDLSTDDSLSVSGRYGYWIRVVDQNTGQQSTLRRETIDFTYFATGSVIGHLQDEVGSPIAGVNVTCGGRTGQSIANGNFTITLVPTGAQTVVPDPASYAWTPPSKNITVVVGQTYDSGTFVAGPA